MTRPLKDIADDLRRIEAELSDGPIQARLYALERRCLALDELTFIRVKSDEHERAINDIRYQLQEISTNLSRVSRNQLRLQSSPRTASLQDDLRREAAAREVQAVVQRARRQRQRRKKGRRG